MTPQNFEEKNQAIRERFRALKKEKPEMLKKRLNLSWSIWGFGAEPLEVSAKRLKAHGIEYVELPGNRYGPDLGYRAHEVNKVLQDVGLKVSGICGLFGVDNDLSSASGIVRQQAIDYVRRNVDLGQAVGASYFLVVPGAVGRPQKSDDQEAARSADSLRLVADVFVASGIKAAVEPIRSAEVSFCHTIEDALDYLKMVNHPGVQHLNGDVYHMLAEETHPGEAILRAGERLLNLHLADSNRRALGDGVLDLDTVIMALYVINYNRDGCFVTAEPLGPGANPYVALFGKPNPKVLDELVRKTVAYFREREDALLAG